MGREALAVYPVDCLSLFRGGPQTTLSQKDAGSKELSLVS